MNIIFISNSMAKAKTLTVLQVSAILMALLVLPVFLTLVLIVPQDTPAQQGVKSSKFRFSFNIGYPQKHLNAYAVQMGELQARIMRFDAQSEGLAKLAVKKKTAAPLRKSYTPISVAAGVIVLATETMPDYGKIDIDPNGSGLETHYAYTFNILLKVGERV